MDKIIKADLKELFGKYALYHYIEMIPNGQYFMKPISGYKIEVNELNSLDKKLENFMIKHQTKGLQLSIFKPFSLSILEKMTFIEYLYFGSEDAKEIKYLKNCLELKHLVITGSKYNNFDFSFLEKLLVCDLSIKKGNYSLYECTTLKFIEIVYKEEDCHYLSNLKNLKNLILNASALKSLEGLEKLTKLTKLTIQNTKIEDINIDWNQLKNLKEISFVNCKYLTNLDGLSNAKNIINIRLENCKKIQSIKIISSLSLIQNISLIDMSKELKDFNFLEKLHHLKFVNMGYSKYFDTLDIFKNSLKLEELMLWSCKNISNIEILGELSFLKRVSLMGFGKISTLKPLCRLENLYHLSFKGTRINDNDIACLKNISSLKEIGFADNIKYNMKEEELEYFIKN